MLILYYPSKKVLAEKVTAETKLNGIGLPVEKLRYSNRSIFGDGIPLNGNVSGSNRPSITRIMVTKVNKSGTMTRRLAGEFFASLKIENGYVVKVS